jgi:hypothetical protein
MTNILMLLVMRKICRRTKYSISVQEPFGGRFNTVEQLIWRQINGISISGQTLPLKVVCKLYPWPPAFESGGWRWGEWKEVRLN